MQELRSASLLRFCSLGRLLGVASLVTDAFNARQDVSAVVLCFLKIGRKGAFARHIVVTTQQLPVVAHRFTFTADCTNPCHNPDMIEYSAVCFKRLLLTPAYKRVR